jgi:D-alanyl-D-alanine carboxypeptidase
MRKIFKSCAALLPLVCSAWLAGAQTTTTIPDQIDAILAGSAVAANTWSILIQSFDGTTTYYQKNPTTGLAPASNTKIFTSSTAFALLGTNAMFETRIYRNGTVANGILTGDLNLVCEHDITWNTSVMSNPRAALDFIATKLKATGLTSVTGNVQCYGCCFYNLSSTDASTHDAAQQLPYNRTAATNFVAALQAQGITVSGIPAGQTGFSAPGALLYTYESTNLTYGGKPLRLDIACTPMLKESHNVMADALLRHIGYKVGTGDSFAAGAAKVISWLGSVGVPTSGIVMNDGSGLSHGNRFTAAETVTLLRYMLNNFFSYGATLPIGCTDGTLAGRFCGTAGSGVVHGKTGSLGISIALSGFLDNPNDNRRYLYSFIANDQSGIDQSATRTAIDASVVLMCARGVPISPDLTSVVNNGDGHSLTVKWTDYKFPRTGYRLYSSADGKTFGAAINLASSAQSYTDTGLAVGTKRYYRVSVLNTNNESGFSRIYGAAVGTNHSPVLIVDGYDRWRFLPAANPLTTNHDFSAIAGQSVSGVPFDTALHTQVTNGPISLANYSSVIWMLGTESTQDESFDANEQAVVTSYLTVGGNLFANGSEIAWDLDRTGTGPTTADRNFYHNQLHAVYSADDANTYAFTVNSGAGAFANGTAGSFDNGTHGTYDVAYPDVLLTTNGSISAIQYSGGTGGNAAVQYNGTSRGGKVMTWGFPFETITSASVRDAFMSDVLFGFGTLPAPQFNASSIALTNNSLLLNWSTSSGLKYRVQYKTNLADATWLQLGAVLQATGTNASQSDSTFGNAPSRFYRIMVAP